MCDIRLACRIFWVNDGIEITDKWAYPTVKTTYESALDIPRVCKAESNPDDRLTCTFANRLLTEAEKAQMTFDQITGDKVDQKFASFVNQFAGQDFNETWNELKGCFEQGNTDDRKTCAFADKLLEEAQKAEDVFYKITVNDEVIQKFESE